MDPELAHERLLEGMIERTPGCRGIDAFTEEHPTREDVTLMAGICTRCDLQLLCRQYAEASRPALGFWAGHRYTARGRREHRPKAA